MNRVITPLKTMSAAISAQEGGLAPVTVSAVETITGINYDMPVASAQVKSALLFAGMQSDEVTIINEKEKSTFCSFFYNMLLSMLARVFIP